MPYTTTNDAMYYSLRSEFGGNLHLGDYLDMLHAAYPFLWTQDGQYDFYNNAEGRVGGHLGDLASKYWTERANAEQLLREEAVLWLDADRHDGAHKLRNRGTGGFELDATIGSTAVGAGAAIWDGALRLNGSAGNYASVPDGASLDITGGIEIVVRLSAEDWTPGANRNILGKLAAAQNSYAIGILANGTPRFTHSADGADANVTHVPATAIPSFVDGQTYWMKVTRSAGGVVTFYTAPDQATEPSSWTQLGASVAGPTSNLFVGTASLTVFDLWDGAYYRAIVRSSIGGTAVFDADFTGRPNLTQNFTEATGKVVTITSTVVAGGYGYGSYVGGGKLNLNGQLGNRASASNSVSVSAAVDRSFVVDITLDDWTPVVWHPLIDSSTGNKNIGFRLTPAGNLSFSIGNGASYIVVQSTVPVGAADGSNRQVAATLDVDNGAGGWDARFWVKVGDSWTQLGSTVTTAGTYPEVVDAAQPISIGSNSPGTYGVIAGQVYRAQIFMGTGAGFSPGGTVVLDANFAALPDGTTQFRESSSNAALVTVVSSNADTNDPLWLRAENDGHVVVGFSGSDKVVVSSGYPAITGDLDISMRMAPLPGWAAGNVCGRFSAGAHSYFVGIASTGALTLTFSLDGTAQLSRTSPTTAPITAGHWMWFRWVRESATGTCRFYYAPDTGSNEILPASWTQLGADVLYTAGAINAATNGELAVLGMGGSAVLGRYGRCIVRDGIAGAAVVDVSTTNWTDANQSTFTASTGQPGLIGRGTAGRKAVVVPGRKMGGRSKFLFGTDDYMEVADNALLDFGPSDSFTVLAVARGFGTPSAASAVVAKAAASSVGWRLWQFNGDGKLYFTINDGTVNAQDPTAAVVEAGVCKVLAGVRNTVADVVVGYQGASDYASGASDTTTGTLANANPVRIGSSPASEFRDMELFGVAVFRRALTASELALIASYYGAA